MHQQGRILLSVVLAASASVCSVVHAQNPDRAQGFYEKNYAESPLKPREGGAFPDGSFTKPKPKQDNQPSLPVNQAEMEKLIKESKHSPQWQKELGIVKPTIAPKLAPLSKDAEERDLTGLERAVPVKALGAIINSANAEHYEKSLAQLTDLAISKDMNIGTIYAIGDMRIASESPLMGKILARGGVVHIVSNIPKGYEVNLSPTFIVKTEEGDVLLEAVSGLSRFFNQRGEFLDREKREGKNVTTKNS